MSTRANYHIETVLTLKFVFICEDGPGSYINSV